ncbi:hypothetical protein V6O07_23100 [Arthrospira platensis SPKY2]|nr:hypothetical protein [Limnospira indica]
MSNSTRADFGTNHISVIMNEIIYPTVNTYLYDLRNSLGESTDDVQQRRQSFFAKIPYKLNGYLYDNEQWEAEYIEILGDQQIIRFGEDRGATYEGFYYPVCLNDSYGLLISCSVNNKTPQPATIVKDLKQEIDRKLSEHKPTLGQTWLIYGELACPGKQNSKQIAISLYQSLFPERNWENDLQGSNDAFESHFFELSFHRLKFNANENISEDFRRCRYSIDEVLENYHVIIILYPHKIVAETIAKLLNFEGMSLFCYRSKILWSYSQSRILQQWLKQDTISIRECLQEIRDSDLSKVDYKQIQKTLNKAKTILPNYAIDLSCLNDQSRTIDINLHDYQLRVRKISEYLKYELCDLKSKSNLTFLSKFAITASQKYLLQIQKDGEYFTSSLETLRDLIDATWAIVEIDRSRRDRNFQNTVAIVGVGLGASSITASLSGQFPISNTNISTKELEQHPIGSLIIEIPNFPKPWLQTAILGFYCLSIAILFAGLTAISLALWNHFRS